MLQINHPSLVIYTPTHKIDLLAPQAAIKIVHHAMNFTLDSIHLRTMQYQY